MSNIDKVYIVFDGTSHYGVWESDLEMEKLYNNIEVVKGPYNDWTNDIDDIIDTLNEENNCPSKLYPVYSVEILN